MATESDPLDQTTHQTMMGHPMMGMAMAVAKANAEAANAPRVLEPLPGAAPDPADAELFSAWVNRHRVAIAGVKATDIVGIGHVMREAGSLLARLKNPEILAAAGAEMPRGILLYGPPGTGKTLTARFMASQIGTDVPFYEFSSDELSAANVRAIFTILSGQGRAVMYIDEIDGFALHRDKSTENARKTLTAMLTGLDGLIITPGVLVICSSNTSPNNLDPALMRSGRIGFIIAFKTPEEDEREALFRHFASTRRTDEGIDWGRAARMTRGKTPADIKQMLDDALGLALMAERATVSEADVLAAVARDGVVLAETAFHADFWVRTALHEAGHVAATCALRGADQVYSVSMSKDGGKTQTGWDKMAVMHRTNRSILDQIVISYAGSRAEMMIYDDFALGSHSDHRNASSIINDLIQSGLAEEMGLLSPEPFARGGLISQAVQIQAMELADRQSKDAQDQATKIVETNRGAIELFARRMVEVSVIDGSLLREVSGPTLQALITECGFECAPDSGVALPEEQEPATDEPGPFPEEFIGPDVPES